MNNDRAGLGQTIYQALSLIFTRYSKPERAVPIEEMFDSQDRYVSAVNALQELSGTKLGTEPMVTTEGNQRRISGLNTLVSDIKQFLNPLMKGRVYSVRIPSAAVRMRNSVSYKEFDVLAFVDSENKTLVLGINENEQYILSDKMYWSDL